MRLLLPKHFYLLVMLLLAALGQLQAGSPAPCPTPTFRVNSPPDAITPAGAACSGDSIEFQVDFPQTGTIYTWNFGDGSRLREGVKIKHAYNRTGASTTPIPFPVTVTARNPACDASTAQQTVYILERPVISFKDANPQRNFSICLPDSVAAKDTTIVIDIVPTPSSSAITSYRIDWGNGAVSEGVTPDKFPLESPAYSDFKDYKIRITGAGPNGCVASFEKVLSYSRKPKAGFEYKKPAPAPAPQPTNCLPIIVAMKDTSSGGNLTYKWEITPKTGFDPPLPNTGFNMDTLALRFTVKGNYQVKLIVINGCGSDTTEQSVLVGYPQVQLPADSTLCGPGKTISYNATNTQYDLNSGFLNMATVRWTVRGGGGYLQTYNEQYPTIPFPNVGEYSVSVFAENDCGNTEELGQTTVQRVIVYSLPVKPVIEKPDIPVCEGSTGNITIRPTGGGPLYALFETQVIKGPPIAPPAQVINIPPPKSNVTYYVRSVNTAGCISDEFTELNITVVPEIENIIEIEDGNSNVCAGQGVSNLVGNGDPNYTYKWQVSTTSATSGFNDAPGSNTEQNYQIRNLTRNSWFKRVVMAGNCESSSNVVQVNVRSAPQIPTIVNGTNQVVCQDSVAVLQVTVTPGNTYRWYDVPTGGTIRSEDTAYEVRGTGTTTVYVESYNGTCPSARVPVTVTVVRPVVNAGPDVTIIQGRSTELRATASPAGASFRWTLVNGGAATSLNNPTSPNPAASPDDTTTYVVKITTPEGCEATDTITVNVIPAIRVPNAFSPNGDTFHDIWEIENIENYPDVRVEVYNRWGNKIYNSTGYALPWDGRHNGQDLPVATYYYIIYLNSSEKPVSGNITIIR